MFLALWISLPVSAAKPAIKVGVLAYEGNDQALARWQPTVDYLNQLIPDYRFDVVPMAHDEIEQSLIKRKLHFVLTNPGHYVRLEQDYGISRISTFKSSFQEQTLNQFGAVILTRADSEIEQLADLQGKKFGAVSQQAFGGYQMALREILQSGDVANVDSIRFVWLGFPQVDIVHAVMNGSVQAGTVRTGVIEKMLAEGELRAGDIRILGPKTATKEFPLQVSTTLYPEWPFARASTTEQRLSEQVALALLGMPADAEAARASRGAGWTIPANYTAVHDLYRFLQLPPYAPTPASLQSVWGEYKAWITLSVFLFLVTLVVIRYLLKANQELRASRISLAQQQGQLEEIVKERTEALHEVNQKLETDNRIIAGQEAEYREVCETLRAMTLSSTRRDLNHQQRLQSIVDIGGRHMKARRVVLSSYSEMDLKVCAVSPIEDAPSNDPIDPQSIKLALAKAEVVRRSGFADGQDYLACPVTVGENLSCVIEMVLDAEAETLIDEAQDLRAQTLQLILQWAANELVLMQQDEQAAELRADDSDKFSGITPREREVLELMAQGLPSKGIARQLDISVKTVELHRSNLLRKTGMQSSLEMVKTAARAGIVA